jgi:hypothetical protein
MWTLILVVGRVFIALIAGLTVVPGILNRPMAGGTIVLVGKPLLSADAGMTGGRIIMLLLRL